MCELLPPFLGGYFANGAAFDPSMLLQTTSNYLS